MKRTHNNRYSKPTVLTVLLLILTLLISGCADPSAVAGESVTGATEVTTTEPAALVIPADGTAFEELPEAFKAEIEQAYAKQNSKEVFLGWANDNTGCVHYYGIYDGCVVLYEQAMTCESEEIKIGNELFWDTMGFNLFACRNGEIVYLAKAYESGWMDDNAISKIADRHTQMLKQRFGDKYEEFNAEAIEIYESKLKIQESMRNNNSTSEE